MRKQWLGACVCALFFWGCVPSSVQPPISINTYNTSSTAKKAPLNEKNTVTYPGSKEKAATTALPPSSTILAMQPMVDGAISSTPIIPPESILGDAQLPSAEQQPFMLPPLTLAQNGQMIRIAVLIPQKTIKKYAITSVNSIMSYMLHQNYSFDLNVFNSGDEKEESIAKALADINAAKYTYIIAPVTNEGANVIAKLVTEATVYIPTLHKSSVPLAGPNIFFGGIDYEQQMTLLSAFANERVGLFEDGSSLGYQLSDMVRKNSARVFYDKRVESSKANFKQMFKGNTSLNSASFYLNTPLVTSSLIASQLRGNSIYPHALLSTQINYNPLLLTLTQYEDRDNMFIANSIQRAPAKLEEINTLFGHDIIYDWVNYSSSIGADLLSSFFFVNNRGRLFKEELINNQIVYNTTIVKPGRHAFNPALE